MPQPRVKRDLSPNPAEDSLAAFPAYSWGFLVPIDIGMWASAGIYGMLAT